MTEDRVFKGKPCQEMCDRPRTMCSKASLVRPLEGWELLDAGRVPAWEPAVCPTDAILCIDTPRRLEKIKLMADF